jgi:hypothetical protein
VILPDSALSLTEHKVNFNSLTGLIRSASEDVCALGAFNHKVTGSALLIEFSANPTNFLLSPHLPLTFSEAGASSRGWVRHSKACRVSHFAGRARDSYHHGTIIEWAVPLNVIAGAGRGRCGPLTRCRAV